MEQECESFDQLEGKYFTYVNDCDTSWDSNSAEIPNVSISYESDEDQIQTKHQPIENHSASSSTSKPVSRWDQKPYSGDKLNSDTDLEKYRDVIRNRRKLISPTISSEHGSSKSPIRYPCDIYPKDRENERPSHRYSTSAIPSPRKRINEDAFARKSFSPSYENRDKRFKNNAGERRSLGSFRPKEEIPCHKGYQLLGDSQLVRFSEQLLGLKHSVTYTEDTNSRRIGYCVSGQKIKDLKERILQRELPISDKLILLIGTNDMIYGTNLKSMCEDYSLILNTLKETAKRIVILTVPPVPKLAHDDHHMSKLKQFNEFVMSCADDQKVFEVNFASLLISYSDTVLTQYFEEVYGNRRRSNSSPRVDLIHLNRDGFKLLSAILDIQYFDKHQFI